MCGIAGFSLNPNMKVDTELLTMSLLLDIEPRGYDATGMAWYENGEIKYNKLDVDATTFIKCDQHFMHNDVTTAILHTRAATQGSPKVAVNNHPVITETIAGVHNGIIANDNHVSLKLDLPRKADVDSEVIFQLIQKFGPGKLGKTLEGDAACAWLDGRDQAAILHLGTFGGRPMWLAICKGDSVLFASTRKAVQNAADICHMDIELMVEVDEGTLIDVGGGEILSEQTTTVLMDAWKRPSYVANYHRAEGPGKTSFTPAVITAKPTTKVTAENTMFTAAWTEADIVEYHQSMLLEQGHAPADHYDTEYKQVDEYNLCYERSVTTDDVLCKYDAEFNGRPVTVVEHDNGEVYLFDQATETVVEFFDTVADFKSECPDTANTFAYGITTTKEAS